MRIEKSNKGFLGDLYDELLFLRRGDDIFERGEWDKKIQLPKWSAIIELCRKSLEETCDLIIGSRLCEALCAVYGIKGLEESIDILSEIIKNDYYPIIEEERENVMYWINKKLIYSIFFNQHLQDNKYEILINASEIEEKMKNFPIMGENYNKLITYLQQEQLKKTNEE